MMPESIANKAVRYMKWQDQHACVFGKLLLMRILSDTGVNGSKLEDLKYTEYGRPYLHSDFDFNISHSGNWVICAMGFNRKVGVDIEEIRPINIDDFKSQFTEKEMFNIKNSVNSYDQFYRYWTKKEAIVKADGKGLNIDLKEIVISKKHAKHGNDTWFLSEVDLSNNCICNLSTDKPFDQLDVRYIGFD